MIPAARDQTFRKDRPNEGKGLGWTVDRAGSTARRRSCNYTCMYRSFVHYKWPCIMNEPPDEPAGLSSQKNGSAISPKSYSLASFCTTGDVLELGWDNFASVNEWANAGNKRPRHFPRRRHSSRCCYYSLVFFSIKVTDLRKRKLWEESSWIMEEYHETKCILNYASFRYISHEAKSTRCFVFSASMPTQINPQLYNDTCHVSESSRRRWWTYYSVAFYRSYNILNLNGVRWRHVKRNGWAMN